MVSNRHRSNKKSGMTLPEVLLASAIMMIIFVLVVRVVFRPRATGMKPSSAQNNRQMALAAIMYGGDYDDKIPVVVNGWLSRMQDVDDKHQTVNCPAPGTQDFPAKHAAGYRRTDAWPLMLMPYLRSRGLFINPDLTDFHNIWTSAPKAATDKDYNRDGATYRNQNRFPMYGMNYMFLAPLRIPANKRSEPDAVNYAVGEGRAFTDADDPSGTVFFTESQHAMDDATRGFFVINAPGMWPAFVHNKDGYVAFWGGTAGSGDWVGTPTACADFGTPCPSPMEWAGSVYTGYNDGCSATFLDGHVKYYRTFALAAGTDYASAVAGADGSGAHIVDKSKYLWNLTNKNYYGL